MYQIGKMYNGLTCGLSDVQKPRVSHPNRELKKMELSITLNLPNNLSEQEWEEVSAVYKSMDGWLDNNEQAYWYGTEEDSEFISASVEPSGLVISGKVNQIIWLAWCTKLCAKLSHALNREIYDAEM